MSSVGIDVRPVFEAWINNPRLITRMRRERNRYGSFTNAYYSELVTSKSQSNRAFCHTQRMLDRPIPLLVDVKISEQLDHLPIDVKILDHGCGCGHTSLSLAVYLLGTGRRVSMGFEDIAIHRQQFAEYLAARLGADPLTDHQVHVLVAQEVLEHEPDPLTTMRQLDRRLLPNGLLLTNIADHTPSSLHISCDLSEVRDYVNQRFTTIDEHRIYIKRKV